MRNLITTLFLMGCLSTLAQTDSTSSKLAFGGGFGVGISHPFIASKNAELNPIRDIQDSLEKPVFSSFFQLGWEWNFSKQNSFCFGLGLVHQGYRIDSILDAGIVNYKERLRYGYLPLMFRHHSVHSSHQFFWGIGLSPKFLISSTIMYDNIRGERNLKRDNSSSKQAIGVDFSVALGVRSMVLKRYYIYSNLYAMQAITPSEKGDLPHFLNSWGISFILMKQGKK